MCTLILSLDKPVFSYTQHTFGQQVITTAARIRSRHSCVSSISSLRIQSVIKLCRLIAVLRRGSGDVIPDIGQVPAPGG